ncbi:hypothetical protein [Methanonatronarchaeum sp. AMET-Sl]|uniref:DUF4870 domain-containing protein n=1 Tax=Methanonatronarchaeum sp. AMET-Sl TaxID=3037654 RepID=UPI00244E5531|nr:hypothetical protein [Methanonatronarchaeum sp. AMET-Sl]WGI18051.1 hypothetical protein QEN48_03355 [Methanonatronarchaeum sp. AMET-Sl]
MSGEFGGSGTVTGLSENVVGALSYLLWFFTGFLFYFIEKDSRFVRFHAVQSIVVFGVIFVLAVILNLLGLVIALPVIGWFLGFLVTLAQMLLGLVSFVLWIYLMYSAFIGEWTKIPFVTSWVEKQI